MLLILKEILPVHGIAWLISWFQKTYIIAKQYIFKLQIPRKSLFSFLVSSSSPSSNCFLFMFLIFKRKLLNYSAYLGPLRYLLERGALTHAQGVTQVENAIAEGRLSEDAWQHVYVSVAGTMGHFCMVLHTMVRFCHRTLIQFFAGKTITMSIGAI